MSIYDGKNYKENVESYVGNISNGNSNNSGIILDPGMSKKGFQEWLKAWNEQLYPKYKDILFQCYGNSH